MKLKYYLRGLGIGIAVTTLILMISYNINGRMSDEEIIRRAKELGMVMTTEESDNLFTPSGDENTTTTVSEETSDEASSDEDTQKTDSDEKETTGDNETEPPTTEPVTTEEPITEEPTTIPVKSFTFSIEKGTSSQAVSELLVKGGIISDAKDFNNYMSRAGYTGIIQRGTYTLNSSMSYEEIAKALIRMEETS